MIKRKQIIINAVSDIRSSILLIALLQLDLNLGNGDDKLRLFFVLELI